MTLAERSVNTGTRATFDAAWPTIVPREAVGSGSLRRVLIATDLTALVIAWVPALAIISARPIALDLLWSFGAIVISVSVLRAHELYLSRISSIRALELARVARATVLAGLAMLAAGKLLERIISFRIREVLIGSALALPALLIGRGAYRAWLTNARRGGRYLRDTVVIGGAEEAADLVDLVADHPEAGYRVVGVLGDRDQVMNHGLGSLWSGEIADALAAIDGRQATGVIIATGALLPAELNGLVRDLQARRIHIQVSNGIRGTDYRRLRPAPIAYEPFFYIEQPVLTGTQVVAKRVIDIAGATLALVVSFPAFALIALGIKLQDRGPVLFRQVRVGRDGKMFKVLKFRTMVVDAEAKLAELAAKNERNGPLFKMDRDPRITRLGRLLRESSLDELPQFINVIKGQMSLVGPRPALPSEVERFDGALLNRTKVHPGITGLWQVEARDNPSFGAYRRLDLYYVDNWSASLDLVIILATLEQVIAKLVTSVVKGRRRGR